MTEQVIQPAEEVTVKRTEYAPDEIMREDEIRQPWEVRRANERRQVSYKYQYVEPCFVCGRMVRDDKYDGCWFVHQTVMGGILRVDVEAMENDDMGWFPLGPECQKQVPKGFKMKWITQRDEGFQMEEA